ncbi:hypothetical protein BG004_000410 [Podila humilis]|nr:hypothetical protein BG004_000410 [Podila humilis]
MPEILAIVFSHLPQWQTNVAMQGDHILINAPDSNNGLYACTLVCRTWYAYFNPILYSVLIDEYTNTPAIYTHQEGLLKHGHHIRTIVKDVVPTHKNSGVQDQISRSVQFSNLNKLFVIHHFRDKSPPLEEMLANIQFDRSQLVHFAYSHRVVKAGELTQDLPGLLTLTHLSTLELFSWRVNRQDFVVILSHLRDTLKTLSLSRINIVSLEDGNSGDDNVHHDDFLTPVLDSKYYYYKDYPNLSLPRIEVLNLHFAWTPPAPLQCFPGLCPRLKALHLIVDTLFDGHVMAKVIASHCTGLAQLTYKEEYSIAFEDGCFLPSAQYNALVESAANPQHQLQHIKLAIPDGLLPGLTDALLLQGARLTTLELRFCREVGMDPKQMLRILTNPGCPMLQDVTLRYIRVASKVLLETLMSEPWTCKKLKYLRMDGYGNEAQQQEQQKQPFSDQGWYITPRFCQRSKSRWDVELKRKFLTHLSVASTLTQLEIIKLNQSKLTRVNLARRTKRTFVSEGYDKDEEAEDEDDSSDFDDSDYSDG